MAVLNFFNLMYCANDADFRVWGKAISDALTTVGIAKSGDTGQIDWATVARPAAFAGYEIRVFGDALQASVPVFIKIEYGIVNTTMPCLRVSVGFATNGAGTLIGYTSDLGTMSVINFSQGAGTMLPYKIAGDTNRVMLVWSYLPGYIGYHMVWSLERTHDAVGGDTAMGVVQVVATGYTTASVQLLSPAAGIISSEGTCSSLMPSVGSGITGTEVSFFPIFVARGPFLNPLLNLAFMPSGAVTLGVPVSVSLLGASRQFMPMGDPIAARGRTGYLEYTTYTLLVRND